MKGENTMENNKFEFTGKVCKQDGEVKVYNKGEKGIYVSKLSIAKKKDKEGNFEYFDFNFFGEELAEKVGAIKKGDVINVTGRIRTNQYTTKGGDKVTTLELIGENVCKAKYDEDKKQFVAAEEGLSF